MTAANSRLWSLTLFCRLDGEEIFKINACLIPNVQTSVLQNKNKNARQNVIPLCNRPFLHDPTTWHKITYNGEQVAQWDVLTSICNLVPCSGGSRPLAKRRGGGGGLDFLALLAFIPSVISSF